MEYFGSLPHLRPHGFQEAVRHAKDTYYTAVEATCELEHDSRCKGVAAAPLVWKKPTAFGGALTES